MSVSWDKWNTDMDTLQTDIDNQVAAAKQLQKDIDDYKTQALGELQAAINSGNYDRAFALLFSMIFMSVDNRFNDQWRLIGTSMSTSAGETNLLNDLKDLSSGSVSGVADPIGTAKNASQALIDKLSPLTTGDYTNDGFNSDDINQIIGQLKNFQTTLSTDFGDGKLADFSAMQSAIKDPNDTNHDKAVDAIDSFQKTFSALTTITQNYSAALNQDASFVGTLQKAWETAIGNMGMDNIHTEMTSINNQISR